MIEISVFQVQIPSLWAPAIFWSRGSDGTTHENAKCRESNTILVKDCTTSHAQALYTSTVLKHFLISLCKVICGYCYVLFMWTLKVQRAQSSRGKFIYKLEKGRIQNWSEHRIKSGPSEISIHFLREYLILLSLGGLMQSCCFNTICRLLILKLCPGGRPCPWL